MRMPASAVAQYQHELKKYWRASGSLRDFLTVLQVRLAQSKVGRLACPARRDVCVDLRDLGEDVHLRSHTTDISVLAELIVHDGYALVLPHFEAPPSRILDLGANIGLASRWFLARWPNARLAAVEPAAENFAVLRKNMAPFGDRARIFEACIGGERGHARLSMHGGAWEYRMSRDETSDDPSVRVITMNDILNELGWPEIDLLKCDIEGAEAEVFAHCEAWIGRVRLAVVECHEPFTARDLTARIRDGGGRFEVVELSRKSSFGCEVVVLKRRPEERAEGECA
jgi:FkbM family methyltransferase